MQHVRDMYDLLLDQLIAPELGAVDYVRGMCDAMGNSHAELEKLIDSDPGAPALH
jgi:hypothetical protein